MRLMADDRCLGKSNGLDKTQNDCNTNADVIDTDDEGDEWLTI